MRPLDDIKVVEFGGLAPGPFCGMVLADFGAQVVRIDKPGDTFNSDILARGKRSIAVSPKTQAGKDVILKLCDSADVVIDPFRPGVLERLGLGPEVLMKRNDKLVIARMSGFRREGKYKDMAGHDVNYLALSGVLSMLRPGGGTPFPPANLLADFAGGGLMCALGILLALLARNKTGKGQIVEADMVTGSRYLASFPLLLQHPKSGSPMWNEKPGNNVLDGAAPFYSVYETQDGKYISVGCLEPHFYAQFTDLLAKKVDSFETPELSDQYNRETWPQLRLNLSRTFKAHTRDEWTAHFAGSDACVAPVLDPAEVNTVGASAFEDHQENELDGHPNVAPRLSATPGRDIRQLYASENSYYLIPGLHSREILREIGFNAEESDQLIANGFVNDAGLKSRL